MRLRTTRWEGLEVTGGRVGNHSNNNTNNFSRDKIRDSEICEVWRGEQKVTHERDREKRGEED